MFKKIMSILKKIRYYFSHEACYKHMEEEGKAVFCMCSGLAGGDSLTDYLSSHCMDCPYWECR